MNENKWIYRSVILGVIAVILGAFGAHWLKDRATAESINSFETGVKYQLIHSLFLLILLALKAYFNHKIEWVFKGIFIGVILFSGSIYLLVFNKIFNWGIPSIIGLITPLGGSIIIISWIAVLWMTRKNGN